MSMAFIHQRHKICLPREAKALKNSQYAYGIPND